jgi:membrane protein YqaA with SNARE-associated domain
MSFWLLITLALILQEGLTTIAVLFKAEQLHYSLLAINAIWLSVTILQIVIAYRLGKWTQKKFAKSKFEQWVRKSAKRLEDSIDSRGEKIALFLFALVISPFVGAFLASWLDLSFSSIFLFTFLGDALWYGSEWATVLGLQELFARAKEIGLLLIILVVFVLLAVRMFKPKKVS